MECPQICHCIRKGRVITSWTETNPGRRFRTCFNNQNPCGFFGWIDPPMCARSKQVIPGLLRKLNRKEEEVKKYKFGLLFMVFMLILSWIVILWCFFKQPVNVAKVVKLELN